MKKVIIIAGLILTLLTGGIALATNYSFPQPGDTNVGTPLRNFFGQTFNLNTSWFIDPVVDVRNYSSIADAVSGIGSTPKTLLIASAQTVTTTVVFPSTLSVEIKKTGSIAKSGSGALVINGPFSAGLYQVFSGFSAGDVTFGAGTVKEVYPELWGAKGDGATDDSVAFAGAFAALPAGGLVQLTYGKTYLIGPAGCAVAGSSSGPSGATPFGLAITTPIIINIPAGTTIKVKTNIAQPITPFIFVGAGTAGGGVTGAGVIDGNSLAGYWGIFLYQAPHISIQGIEAKNFTFSPIRGQLSNYLNIDNVYSHDNGDKNTPAYGAVLYGCQHSTTTRCKFANNSMAGWATVQNDNGSVQMPGSYNTIQNCQIDSCGTVTGGAVAPIGGISIDNNNPHISVIGNTITNCGGGDTTYSAGIFYQFGNNYGLIANNQIYNTNGYGIKLSGGAVSVHGNLIRSSAFHGIFANAILLGKINDNKILNSSASASPRYDAINLLNSFRISVVGNWAGDDRGTQFQGWGVNENGTSDNNVIDDNNFYLNVLGTTNTAGAGTKEDFRIHSGTFTMTGTEASHWVIDNSILPGDTILYTSTTLTNTQIYTSSTATASFIVSTGTGTFLGTSHDFTYFMFRKR